MEPNNSFSDGAGLVADRLTDEDTGAPRASRDTGAPRCLAGGGQGRLTWRGGTANTAGCGLAGRAARIRGRWGGLRLNPRLAAGRV